LPISPARWSARWLIGSIFPGTPAQFGAQGLDPRLPGGKRAVELLARNVGAAGERLQRLVDFQDVGLDAAGRAQPERRKRRLQLVGAAAHALFSSRDPVERLRGSAGLGGHLPGGARQGIQSGAGRPGLAAGRARGVAQLVDGRRQLVNCLPAADAGGDVDAQSQIVGHRALTRSADRPGTARSCRSGS
jgi:hypothetical protein